MYTDLIRIKNQLFVSSPVIMLDSNPESKTYLDIQQSCSNGIYKKQSLTFKTVLHEVVYILIH